jgi:DNA-binding CsgD family transcriptional regulator
MSANGGLAPEPLTRREREILALLAQGLSGPEIAEQLTLGLSSVKSHIQHLYGKLGANSKRQAVARARRGRAPQPWPLPARRSWRSRPQCRAPAVPVFVNLWGVLGGTITICAAMSLDTSYSHRTSASKMLDGPNARAYVNRE